MKSGWGPWSTPWLWTDGMTVMDIQVAAVSEIGSRKRDNQDCLLVRVGEGPAGDFGFFLVADGMGGEAGGRQAAELAVRCGEDWWCRILPKILAANGSNSLNKAVHSLQEVVLHLNEGVLGLGERMGARTGTTFSALFLHSQGYGYVHVGDSRIYKAAPGLQLLTRDDTWVAQQVRSGAMSPAQAAVHPKRHVLTQCIGSASTIQIQSGCGVAEPGAGFILCSDGFYQPLTGVELSGLVARNGRLEQQLCQAASAVYDRGAPDNLTAIAVLINGHHKEGTSYGTDTF